MTSFSQAITLTSTDESPPGTSVPDILPAINASPTPGVAGAGNLLTISGGQVANNGVIFTGTSAVTRLYYINHTAYQFGSGAWFGPITAASSGTAASNPVPAITGISLSTLNFTLSSQAVTVAAITVQMTGGTFSGTLALSGAQAGQFTISNGNLVANANDSLTTYAITITATSGPIFGVTVAPFSQSFTITAQSATTWPNNPPPQVKANGFAGNLVFYSDFLATTEFDPQAGGSSANAKWFTYTTQTSPANYTVMTSATAASISNGNVGGGSFASPSGGIWLCSGASITNNMEFFSVPTTRWATAGTPGSFQHMYLEAYLQFRGNGTSTGGWPAFWTYSTQSEASGGATGSEIDIVEVNQGANQYGGVVHLNSGPAISGTPTYSRTPDSNWHLYGLLWKSTGTGTGSFSIWIDNVQVGNTIPTGTGSNAVRLEGDNLFIAMGTGIGWPMYVDYVRVFQ